MGVQASSIEELMRKILAREDLTFYLFDSFGKQDAEVIMAFATLLGLKNPKILDYGCGLGRILKHLPSSAEGYDINPSMREHGLKWCGREILPDLLGREKYYDLIIAVLVIQHAGQSTPLADTVNSQLSSVLKENGYLITVDTDPDVSKLPEYELPSFRKLVTFKSSDNVWRIYQHGQSNG